MAKKVRRPRKRRVETSSTAVESRETTSAKSMSDQEAFESEYAYVLKDLRWVFILAAIMFALLIVLNLVLTA